MKPLDALLILVSILFATGVIVDQRWGPVRNQHRANVRFQQSRLDFIEEKLKEFERKTGGYPSTEDGLDVIPGLAEASLSGPFAPLVPLLGDKDGIRTMHGIPFLYENRNGISNKNKKFRASPARADQRRRYSRHVDGGVFVTSLGLRQDVKRVFGRAWLDALLLFSGGVIVFLAIAYVFARNRKSTGDRVKGINAMIMVGVALLLTVIIGLSGGRRGVAEISVTPPSPGPEGERNDLLEDYLQIIERFARAGVCDPDRIAQQADELRREFGLAKPVGGEVEPGVADDDESDG